MLERLLSRMMLLRLLRGDSRRFEAEVKSGLLPMGGRQKSLKVGYDCSKAKELFGIEFVRSEEQVVELAKKELGISLS